MKKDKLKTLILETISSPAISHLLADQLAANVRELTSQLATLASRVSTLETALQNSGQFGVIE